MRSDFGLIFQGDLRGFETRYARGITVAQHKGMAYMNLSDTYSSRSRRMKGAHSLYDLVFLSAALLYFFLQ
jgi:hypothetical protein